MSRMRMGGWRQAASVRRGGPSIEPTPSLFEPSASIASTTGRTFVVRIQNGRTEWVDVKSGLTQGNTIEVFGDLHAGDRIVSRGTDEIPAGTEVQIRQATAPAGG